jgi:hypothetical protein
MVAPNGQQPPPGGYSPHGLPPPPPRSIPGVVIAACVLWMLFGALGLVGGLAGLAMGAKGGSVFQLAIAAAFLITGVQVLMGKASSILVSGIACIVLGGVTMLLVLMVARYMPGVLMAIATFNSLVLIVAGILACVGNRNYKRWRAGKFHLPFPG